MDNSVQVLAAYATLKGMMDGAKNQYYVLAEYIKDIISEHRLCEFSVAEMTSLLGKECGFEVPYVVVKAALKKINGLRRKEEDYKVIDTDPISSKYKDINKAFIEKCASIKQQLEIYVLANHHEDGVWLNTLEEEFVRFLLDKDEASSLKYSDLISKFLLSINDNETKEQLQAIREGAVLYSGLRYNIIDVGSITEDLSLYLDTEILFDIAGLNGEIYQRIADDFLALVKQANEKRRHINLYYFEEVQREIEKFFKKAERIVAGKEGFPTTRAMSKIVTGCLTKSDVVDKASDFNLLLKRLNINVDNNRDEYYQEKSYAFNLESIHGPEKNESKIEEAVKFISHINILRRGQQSEDYSKSGYLLISDTKLIHVVSNKLKPNNKCGFALPISTITDYLWFKLGNGFGKAQYPYDVNAAIKARMVLSGSLATSVGKLYDKYIKEYKEGELTKEQTTARLQRLQDLLAAPEDINSDNVDDLFDFSPQSMNRYKDAQIRGEEQLRRKDAIINTLTETEKIKNERIEVLEEDNKAKDNALQEKDEELKRYKDKENRRRKVWKAIKYWTIRIIIITFFILAFFGVYFLLDNIKEPNWLREAIKYLMGAFTLYASLCTVFPKLNIFHGKKRQGNNK